MPELQTIKQKYGHIIKAITCNSPPDFSLLDRELQKGLDINSHEDSEYIDDQETLFSLVLSLYAEDIEAEEYPYLPDVVRYFLDRGYDVHANNEANGIVAFDKFVYPSSIDKYTLEAAKILLQAGVNTEVPIYPEDEDADFTSLYYLALAHDGDNRGITQDDLEAANYFYPLHRMMDFRKKGLDYSGVYHYCFAEGRQIRDIFISGDFQEKIDYQGNTHRHSFDRLYLDCDGMMLCISGDLKFIIEPISDWDLKKPLKSCRETFPEIIGHIIKKIEFRYIPVPEYPFYSMYEGHIMLDGGIDLITAAAFTEVKSSCKNIQYIDVRK